MKYLKLRVIEPTLNLETTSFSFDEEEPEDDYEKFLDVSDFTYRTKTIYLNCYRIGTIEPTSINGVNVSFIQLDQKHIVISYLSPDQLFTMIHTEGAQIDQITDAKVEKNLLKKMNTHKDLDKDIN